MSTVRIAGARFTHIEHHPEGIRASLTGHLVPPLPDLATADLATLREAEWSGREPCTIGDGAWMTCQVCGAAKIDGKGHKPGCAMAAALAARAE